MIKIPEELIGQYLNEKRLGIWLSLLFPNIKWIHNKWLNGYRPDYVSHDLKLIVEFDGHDHYRNTGQVLHDTKRDNEFNAIGYKTIRIPYFIQLSPATVNWLFKLDIEFEQQYPHGFIDSRATVPGGFCEAGLYRLYSNMHYTITEVREQVFKSLKDKLIEEYNPIVLVPHYWAKQLIDIDDYNEFWKSIYRPVNPFVEANRWEAYFKSKFKERINKNVKLT